MSAQPRNATTLRIAYLSSEYPAISHTFIYREVCALRAQGIEVVTASIRRPERLDRMTLAEQREARTAFYIKASLLRRALRAHAALALSSPKGYAAMLGRALGLWRRWPIRLSKIAAYFAEAGLLVRWMQHEQTGHVHVHFGNPAATVALIAEAYPGVAYSLSIHGPDVFYNIDTNALPEKVQGAAFVRCISHFCRSQVMRLTPVGKWSDFSIVRCGVDLDKFQPRPEPDNAVPEILCVGRLVPAKGQHVLLRACRALHAFGRPFHLTLVGDGPDRSSLEEVVRASGLEERVTFTGAIGQGDVQQYYDRADVFVLASFAEGLPVVLMEAMAKEIACISTPVAAIGELIEDGRNGLLVPPSDADALADALGRLLGNPDLRKQLGRCARERVAAEYDVNANGIALADLFRRYAAGKA